MNSRTRSSLSQKPSCRSHPPQGQNTTATTNGLLALDENPSRNKGTLNNLGTLAVDLFLKPVSRNVAELEAVIVRAACALSQNDSMRLLSENNILHEHFHVVEKVGVDVSRVFMRMVKAQRIERYAAERLEYGLGQMPRPSEIRVLRNVKRATCKEIIRHRNCQRYANC